MINSQPNKQMHYGSYGKVTVEDSGSNVVKTISKSISNDTKKEQIIKKRFSQELVLYEKVKSIDNFVQLVRSIQSDIEYRLVLEQFHDNFNSFISVQKNNPFIINQQEIFFSVITQILTIYEHLVSFNTSIENVNLNNFLIQIKERNAIVKYIDFGLSYGCIKEKIEKRLGVPFSFPPEFFKKSKKDYEKSLVWSLGIILYQLSYYSHPFGMKTKIVTERIAKFIKSNETIDNIIKIQDGSLIDNIIKKSKFAEGLYGIIKNYILVVDPDLRKDFKYVKNEILKVIPILDNNKKSNGLHEKKQFNLINNAIEDKKVIEIKKNNVVSDKIIDNNKEKTTIQNNKNEVEDRYEPNLVNSNESLNETVDKILLDLNSFNQPQINKMDNKVELSNPMKTIPINIVSNTNNNIYKLNQPEIKITTIPNSDIKPSAIQEVSKHTELISKVDIREEMQTPNSDFKQVTNKLPSENLIPVIKELNNLPIISNQSYAFPSTSMLMDTTYDNNPQCNIILDTSNPLIKKLSDEVNAKNIKSKFVLATLLLGPSDWNIEFPYEMFRDSYTKKIKVKEIEQLQVNPAYSLMLLKEILQDKEVPSILNIVGLCYERGYGTKPDYKESLSYFRKANKLSYLPAKINVARYYYFGIEAKRNEVTAEEMIKSCETTNEFPTLLMLTNCYLNGDGIKRNVSTAEKFLNLAIGKINDHPMLLNLKKILSNATR